MKSKDPLQRLREFVADHETQTAAAKALGISSAYLSDLLKGRRLFSNAMLTKLGLVRMERVVEAHHDH